MLKCNLIVLIIALFSLSLRAQETTTLPLSQPHDLLPTELIQVYKTWLIDDPDFYKYTFRYLMTVDNHWYPLFEPIRNDEEFLMDLGYMFVPKDFNSWYKNKEYMLALIWDKRSNAKVAKYKFLSRTTWDKYLNQMGLMNAVKQEPRSFEGGNSTVYIVNNLSFMLIEFPPGINGEDATFEVQIQKI